VRIVATVATTGHVFVKFCKSNAIRWESLAALGFRIVGNAGAACWWGKQCPKGRQKRIRDGTCNGRETKMTKY
jgi:hypothetical protein